MILTRQNADTSDIEAIYLLSKKLIDDYEDTSNIDYDRVISWVYKKIKESISEYTRVYLNGVLAGYYHFYKNDDGIYEIDDLYVFDKFQNCGIGTQIIKECISLNEDVMLYVFIKNEKAVSLYKRLGFEIVETVHETRYIMKYKRASQR